MEKINFKDLPSTETPINSDNLNEMQNNVEEAINEEKARSKFSITSLYISYPSAGQIGTLSIPNSSATITEHKWSDFDFLIIEVATRVWGYARKTEFIPVTSAFQEANMKVDNLYTIVAPIYASNELATMQYYFTNDNTITIDYNSDYEGDNHLYISKIMGVKIK